MTALVDLVGNLVSLEQVRTLVAEYDPDTDRVLLVEKNPNTGERWVTTWPTPEEAARYSTDQEYADYEIESVIEIDTGDEYDIEFVPVATKRSKP